MSNIIICLHYKPQKTQAYYKLDTGKAHIANGENSRKLDKEKKRGEKAEREGKLHWKAPIATIDFQFTFG